MEIGNTYKNKENIEHILSRVKDENLAIRYWDHYGPSFGSGDLTIYGGYGGFRNENEIELRTSKDNENENSEARDNITYNEIRLFCRLRKLQKPISFFSKINSTGIEIIRYD
ncbi:hypothetical protein RhiirA4_465994 [Rhizophagus irregularis]|uniref:Uncharacterized protein n=1 Tax=Rhizophagus irregularis TaxID=588596 RepID=A0A2I1GT66_9GLOM|nr:hypothetical protein RhiirA4_465994 [Rhizophagus irregularis]